MTNNFSTIKLEQASEKFYLIRVTPRRYLNDLLTSVGGGKYTATFQGFIYKVTANSTDLTKVTTVTNPNEYSYNETTSTLTVYSTPSSSNAIVVHYYLFYTGGRYRVVYEDPEDNSTSLRDWLPRIKSNPTLNSSIEDIINGQLSISLSSFSIINNEREFNQYLSVNDSFNLADIKIWLCLDSSQNIQKIFDGKIKKVNISDTQVSFEISDPLEKLNAPAYMGDSFSECFLTTSSFANLDPNFNFTPIPYIIGSVSKYKLVADTTTSLTTAYALDKESLLSAICTSYSTEITTSNNREWSICRADDFVDFGFTPSDITGYSDYTRMTGTSAQIAKFFIGDTFIVTQSGSSYYTRVINTDKVNNYLYTTKINVTTGAIVVTNDCPSIAVVSGDNIYYCLYGRDYTATVSNLTTNKYLKITFVSNFEANFSGMTALDPGSFTVKYRVKPDTTNAKHGSVVSKLLTCAGLTVDSDSVSAANSSLTVNCNFMIPEENSDEFDSYLKYTQDVLMSACSYISFNNDFEIGYNLFSAPSSIEEVTKIDIINDSFNVDIDYNDIVTYINASNINYDNEEVTRDANNTPSMSLSSVKYRYLHGIDNSITFNHVLESINSVLPTVLKIRGNRFAKYSFATKIINIDNILGDDILLSRDSLLGTDTSKSLKILTLDKSPKQTNIIATDLIDL